MAFARVTALISVVTASVLALSVPGSGGAGMPILIGWMGVIALAIGVGLGETSAVVLAGAAFVLRLAMHTSLVGAAVPRVSFQVPLLVLSIELAVVSIDARTRPRRPSGALGRVVTSVIVATLASQILEAAVLGTSGGGTLLRVGALATVVIVAGWVTVLWSRAVE